MVLLEEVVDEWSVELEVEEAVELVLAPSAGTASVCLDVHRSRSSGRRIMKILIGKYLRDWRIMKISISKGLVDYGQKGTLSHPSSRLFLDPLRDSAEELDDLCLTCPRSLQGARKYS